MHLYGPVRTDPYRKVAAHPLEVDCNVLVLLGARQAGCLEKWPCSFNTVTTGSHQFHCVMYVQSSHPFSALKCINIILSNLHEPYPVQPWHDIVHSFTYLAATNCSTACLNDQISFSRADTLLIH